MLSSEFDKINIVLFSHFAFNSSTLSGTGQGFFTPLSLLGQILSELKFLEVKIEINRVILYDALKMSIFLAS